MKFCIVSPPTVTEFDKDLAETDAIRHLAEHAPVGVLTLAGVLDAAGRPLEVVDMNVLYYDYLHSEAWDDPAVDFSDYAVADLSRRDYDVIGFGTICSSYPLTLRIATGLRQARPEAPILLGGPQASVVDVPTLEAFPAVDFVVRGEAEETLPRLLDALVEDADLEGFAGLTYRKGGRVMRNPGADLIADLDALPMPAYHLYPYLQQASYIPLELGRGCPYACTFCSTNDFFRRKFRLKTPGLIVEQMSELKKRYDIAVFDLIHDMFTVDRRKVVEFCEAVLASGESFYWNCSARTDRIDAELLELMSEAGCRGVFFGIETGSQTLQKTVKKGLVLTDAMVKIRAASERNISVAASLITGFPDETEDDFRDTAGFFVDALRYANASPQLHILAPLGDTPLYRRYQDQLTFDDIVSDMAHQGWDQNTRDRELIAAHPEIFPSFYAIPTPLDRPYIKEVRSFLLSGFRVFRWLLVALHQEEGHILEAFDAFVAWRDARVRGTAAEEDDRVPYFQGKAFREDFVAFVRERYLDGSPTSAVLAAILDYETSFDDVLVDDPTTDVPSPEEIENGKMQRLAFQPGSVPGLASGVKFLEVDVDYQKLMECIVERRNFDEVPRVRQKLASRKLPGAWPEVLQLSPISAAVLELCDGGRTVEDISRSLKPPSNWADVPADKACLIGLELLRHDGLIEDATPAA